LSNSYIFLGDSPSGLAELLWIYGVEGRGISTCALYLQGASLPSL